LESGLRIRIDNDLREAFIKACKARDTTAAQVLRSFMREFVQRAEIESAQGTLFAQQTT
jgi:antitoxin component of RelBE/YafQ-DinJ toxin-antitoxin module